MKTKGAEFRPELVGNKKQATVGWVREGRRDWRVAQGTFLRCDMLETREVGLEAAR